MTIDNRRITAVYQFTNGNVLCFDQFGKQMPEYQGNDAIERLRATGYNKPIVTYEWRNRHDD